MSTKRSEGGFSLIELLIVVAIIAAIASIVVPMLLDSINNSRQRRTMADMRAIATANGAFRTDYGVYAASLDKLVPRYIEAVSFDAWRNAYEYRVTDYIPGREEFVSYELRSLGSDGARGPKAPDDWDGDDVSRSYEPDLVLRNGEFTQAPTGQ